MMADMSEMTTEQLEAQAAEATAKLAAIRRKQGKPVPPVRNPAAAGGKRKAKRDGDTLREIQNDMSVKNQTQIMLSGYAGKTIIQQIEEQMDKRRKIMQDMVIKHGMHDCLLSEVYLTNKGRYQGLAAALALLRTSGLKVEIERSNERLGIE